MKKQPQNIPRNDAMKVCIVTGTRAEFGIWRPVLHAIKNSPHLKLQLVATGMHLLPQFGNTVGDIEAAGFKLAARVLMYAGSEPPARSLARGIENLATAFDKLRPDLIMVLGDRLEMLAAASAALACRIPIAHVHGGETAPGIWDEQIRHALTKMSHLHFCATPATRNRILNMGEKPAAVHRVGAPALDTAVAFIQDLRKVIPKKPLSAGMMPLLLLHPSSSDDDLECRRTLALVDLLKAQFQLPVVHAIGPNNDPGHKGILRAYAQRSQFVHLQMSVPQDKFWLDLISCGILVGNSSAGIIEAASFGIPVINIGDRQAGRERNPNVIDVPWNSKHIAAATGRALNDKAYFQAVSRCKNIYGDGNASHRIVSILETLANKGIPLEKRFVDA